MNAVLPADPARDDVLAARPTLWLNPLYRRGAIETSDLPISPADVQRARMNWQRLAPLLAACFPELESTNGEIRSELVELKELREALGYRTREFGNVFIKADSHLPVAGSIKARGGLYEVFVFAESLARDNGLVTDGDDIRKLKTKEVQTFFSKYTVAVGSTGNLGLSVGIAARALGFKATVHMSSDAKAWKVERLRKLGVEVIQHEADYTIAVEKARDIADADPTIYFVDDEQSKHLFLGYSAAASELAEQLDERGITVDADNPLFLYLPCGIGGAPGGVAFGAKATFGDNVHAFFVEPVQSPCALVHMMSGSQQLVSVYDVGLTNKTEADGMAVARMSAFVATVMREILAGVFTVADDELLTLVRVAWTVQGQRLEPSAAAALLGPGFLVGHKEGKRFQDEQGIRGKMTKGTHVLWTTGGSHVPEEQFQAFLRQTATVT
ncbi:D-serine ammonia-lyase [Agrobacterium sp. SOY23]|uniref:D-serine ammonia-lyase n=1 Tax=Agrobacterium sp. SOY23 TaxID=3014555 RepID=UPI0022AE5FB3|nr:D-serine ammonia-lyase [Agrobacterium sp. SOY23]MCZ4432121.1 D-serine ammonia-lyase [Agrobacterium sp. SOY23]